MASDLAFQLKHLPEVLGSSNATEESASRQRRGDDRTGSTESTSSSDTRIQEWAARSARTCTTEAFAQTLDGAQVEGELMRIFRETPEFGRSLAERVAEFVDEDSEGHCRLIGGGGEAVVFGDDERQEVIKWSGSVTKAGFGWCIAGDETSGFRLQRGNLTETLQRFELFEQHFSSGLELDQLGHDGGFLLMRQPFILGTHPDESTLHVWMRSQGWKPWEAPADLGTLRNLSWRKDAVMASDVRPENVILSATDQAIYAIDFIVRP